MPGFLNLRLGLLGECPDAEWCSGSFPPAPSSDFPFRISLCHPLENITFRWDHRKLREASPVLRVRIINDRRNCGVNPPTIIRMTNPPQEIAEYRLCMGQEVATTAFLICSWVGVRPQECS